MLAQSHNPQLPNWPRHEHQSHLSHQKGDRLHNAQRHRTSLVQLPYRQVRVVPFLPMPRVLQVALYLRCHRLGDTDRLDGDD